jgi:hypothetical protein
MLKVLSLFMITFDPTIVEYTIKVSVFKFGLEFGY